MTDRYDALTVVLDHNIRDDDAEALISAIRQLRGVLDVRGHVSDGLISRMVEDTRIRSEISQILLAALYPKDGKDQ